MHVPILIVGGGPAGLCTSILLSRYGVRSLLIERHPSTSIHPKATAISTRTMELFREWGIEPRIRELELSVDFVSSVRTNLAAPETERRSLGFPTREEASLYSPTYPAVLAQDVLEPILAEHARSFEAADVRFDTELRTLEQDEHGAMATIVDRATGAQTTVHARYVVAADGAASPIRGQLGIATRGVERIGEYLSILFRAQLEPVVGAPLCGLYMLHGLGGPVPSVVVPTSRDERWVLATPWRGDARPLSTLSAADLVDLVRRAAGTPDLAVDVLDHQLVGIGAEVAERFRAGNVFLVGDAAHRTAPTGGTGMNTAIHAAHNLAWKLAMVLGGFASQALLDSYELERRPSGERNLLRSLGQLQGVSGVAADLGVVYASAAVFPEDGIDMPPVIEPTVAGCVGSRAPHLWLDADGHRLSTHDLFGHRFVLVTGVGGGAWRNAARRVSADLVPLGAVVLDGAELGVLSADWMERYGTDVDGAVLVRPDGHIAWRSAGAAADPTATLHQILARVLGIVIGEQRRLVPSIASGDDRRCA